MKKTSGLAVFTGMFLTLTLSLSLVAPVHAYRNSIIEQMQIGAGEMFTSELANYKTQSLNRISPSIRDKVAASAALTDFVTFYESVDSPVVRSFMDKKIDLLSTLEELKGRLASRSDMGAHQQEILDFATRASNINFYGQYSDHINDLFYSIGDYIYKPEHSKLDIEKNLPEWTNQLTHAIPDNREQSRLAKYNDGLLPFRDTDDHEWFTPYVWTAKDKDIISGYRNNAGSLTGEFGPGNNVTLAEMAKMATIAAGMNPEYTTPTNIQARTHWAKTYVRAAESRGTIIFMDPNLNIDRKATRAEVVQAMAEIFGIDTSELADAPDGGFSDVDSDSPAAKYINWAKEKEIVSGDKGDTTFRPDDGVVRAEMAKILINFMAYTGRL